VPDDRIRRIVIVGGDAAGWLAAAILARRLKPPFCDIRVVDMPTEGAGAFSLATLPSFHRLNALLAINEGDLMRNTRATFRLGAEFVGWDRIGARYFHTFGSLGARLEAVPFHHYWTRLRQGGNDTTIEDYSTATVAAKRGRFARPTTDPRSVLSLYSYGHHFHAGLLTAYLREYAKDHGVVRIAGEVVDVSVRGEDGFIDSLRLRDGTCVRADLYVDCTGVRGLLSQAALNTGYVDWSHWLPCDRAVAVPCVATDDLPPHSQVIADQSGWRWRIPLQQCLDTGFVYSSGFVSDDASTATLMSGLTHRAISDPYSLRFSPGRPARFWNKNCLTLAGPTLEPLESTMLHLVQTGITRFLALFPVQCFSALDVKEYNRLTTLEYDRIRDFLILHYKATARNDSPFWDYCRQMDVPDTLRDKIELFRRCGRLAMLDEEHFGEDSWLAVLLGQNVHPQVYDPLADVLEVDDVRAALSRMWSAIHEAVDTLPTHRAFIEAHCQAAAMETM
jgi:tryptophan halogenase